MSRFPGLPDDLWRHGTAVCIELADWSEFSAGPAWVDLVERILAAMNLSPAVGYALSRGAGRGRADNPETRGAWRRIRDRASNILGTHAQHNVIDANSGYQYRVGESERNAYVLLNNGSYFPIFRCELGIAVATGLAQSPDALLQKVGHTLANSIQPRWGGVFEFPAAAGADFYLFNGGYTGPEVRALGPSPIILAEHEKRLLRVKNRSSTEYSFGAGYVREVYEVNFLSGAHLRAPLQGASVRDYAGRLGKLTRSEYWPDLFEWRLSDQELARARRDWEESGLVLAAEREPFRWQ